MNSSGTNNGALNATTQNGGNATVTNSGSNIGDIDTLAETGGNATATNSGRNTGDIDTSATNNATSNNSGSVSGGVVTEGNNNAAVINSGVISNLGGPAIVVSGKTTTLTNIVGGRAIGDIGAMGVDRAFGPNLRLGAFAGDASREDVELSVQSIDSTCIYGGAYGRFDWATQYLDFSLYGAASITTARAGLPTTRWRAVLRPRPRAMAAGSSARK